MYGKGSAILVPFLKIVSINSENLEKQLECVYYHFPKK